MLGLAGMGNLGLGDLFRCLVLLWSGDCLAYSCITVYCAALFVYTRCLIVLFTRAYDLHPPDSFLRLLVQVTGRGLQSVWSAYLLSRMKSNMAYLVAREDQSIGDHNILPPASGEDNDLGDVVGCEWFTVTTGSLALLVNVKLRLTYE